MNRSAVGARVAEAARLIGAVAAKDIVDALRNRIVLSILVGVVVMGLSSVAMPLIGAADRTPTAYVFDPGRSAPVRALTQETGFRLRLARSEADMLTTVSRVTQPVLGLALPADLAASPTARGYAAFWLPQERVAALTATFEAALSEAAGRPVRIELAAERLYPSLEGGGSAFMSALGTTIVILTIGLALVPYLLVDEKEARTLDALLVAPIRYGHILAGKALAGLSYCLTATLVMALISARYVVHGPLLGLAALLGGLMAVGLGLLVGALVENPPAIGLPMTALLLTLLTPAVLLEFGKGGTALGLRAALPWIPAASLTRLLHLAQVGEASAADVLPCVVGLATLAAAAFALALLRVRRER
jgi:ABC-type transport system involved in multi-copper enzyme maturation permease subunit